MVAALLAGLAGGVIGGIKGANKWNKLSPGMQKLYKHVHGVNGELVPGTGPVASGIAGGLLGGYLPGRALRHISPETMEATGAPAAVLASGLLGAHLFSKQWLRDVDKTKIGLRIIEEAKAAGKPVDKYTKELLK